MQRQYFPSVSLTSALTVSVLTKQTMQGVGRQKANLKKEEKRTMEKEVLEKYYLKEFLYLDGAYEIIFNIVDINFDKKTINVAVTKCGGISVREYDLHQDENGNWYFNYGIMQDEIQIDEFETIKD